MISSLGADPIRKRKADESQRWLDRSPVRSATTYAIDFALKFFQAIASGFPTVTACEGSLRRVYRGAKPADFGPSLSAAFQTVRFSGAATGEGVNFRR